MPLEAPAHPIAVFLHQQKNLMIEPPLSLRPAGPAQSRDVGGQSEDDIETAPNPVRHFGQLCDPFLIPQDPNEGVPLAETLIANALAVLTGGIGRMNPARVVDPVPRRSAGVELGRRDRSDAGLGLFNERQAQGLVLPRRPWPWSAWAPQAQGA